jgi:hypothetical protein
VGELEDARALREVELAEARAALASAAPAQFAQLEIAEAALEAAEDALTDAADAATQRAREEHAAIVPQLTTPALPPAQPIGALVQGAARMSADEAAELERSRRTPAASELERPAEEL